MRTPFTHDIERLTRGAMKATLDYPWLTRSGSGVGDQIVTNESASYSKIPLVFRALQLRCDGLARVPVTVYEGEKEIERYFFEDSLPLHDLIWNDEAAYLLKGAGFVLKEANTFGFDKNLRWLNPFYMQWMFDYDLGEYQFWQLLPGGERYPKNKPYWLADDFLYFKAFNPLDDLAPGPSAASVAIGNAQVMGSVTAFLGNFFSADALPVTLAIVPGGTSEAEIENVETQFKKKFKGLRKAVARIMGIAGDVKLEKLTPELKTFEFDKIDNHAINEICWAFGAPKSLLVGEAANYATAQVDKRLFLENTLIPRTKFYESIINPYLDEVAGQRIEFKPQELPEMQEDESIRADALSKMVAAGTPLQAAYIILGYDIPEDAQKIIDAEEKKKEEARKNPPPQLQPPPQQGNNQTQMPQGEPIKSDLDKWFRKSLNAVKAGKSAAVDFESDAIPKVVKALMLERLKSIQTEDELRNVFTGDNGHA